MVASKAASGSLGLSSEKASPQRARPLKVREGTDRESKLRELRASVAGCVGIPSSNKLELLPAPVIWGRSV